MKNTSQIITLLLALALVILAVKITLIDSKSSNNNNGDIDKTSYTMDNILTRSSVRSYTSQKVDQEKVEQLLRAAMAAPTAGNKQPWAFVVVDQKELLDQLSTSLPYAKMTSKASLAIIVCGDTNKMYTGQESDYWIQDCSAATENLLLAAHSLGLGAVWTAVAPVEDRISAVKSVLNLPDNLIPLNVIPVGYPSGENKPKDKWNPSVIHYNKL
ncbi:MAG: nitroreductase family protein [Bacteroidales bacterium]